jgi:hypothetical protein
MHASEALFIAQIVMLGPSVFGKIWPEAQSAVFAAGNEQKAMLEAVSELGT